jgi:predicted SprT family Zn-dependent metalloprotease
MFCFKIRGYMLAEMVLAVCLHTALACNDIAISFKDFHARKASYIVGTEIQAQAYMTNFGNQGIWFNEKFRDASEKYESYLLRIIVHEIAHLEVFVETFEASDHGSLFKKKCVALADKVGVSTASTCQGVN